MDEKEFESVCMKVIKKIVLISRTQTRQGAIAISKKMLEKVKSDKKSPADILKVYERVVFEFETASDATYNELRKQLFLAEME